MSQSRLPGATFALALAVTWAAQACAQPTYSIDEQGPTVGLPDPGGLGPITGGDILTPTPPVGPPPPPTIVIPVGPAGLGVVPTALGLNEVDALAYGVDDVIFDQQEIPSYYYFSVDEFAVGLPSPLPPNVFTEGAAGALEASADVYVYPPAPFIFAPFPPFPPGPVIGNTGVYDGNGGLTPFPSPTLNLIEPNPPSPLTFMGPDPGDNLDAVDVDDAPGYPVFYSLDSGFPDPLEVPPGGFPPPNTGTAIAQIPPFVGGDVLVTVGPGGPPALYAPAPLLGLDTLGADTDDLDALILNDWSDGFPLLYTPTTGPYSWLVAGPAPTDMLLYSLRRDSALIGTPDALFGAPIEEGDILLPVLLPGGGFAPGIWIPAEALGLATVRSFTGAAYGVVNPKYGLDMWADDLDALDVTCEWIARIPEPSTLALSVLAAVAACLAGRRKGRSAD